MKNKKRMTLEAELEAIAGKWGPLHRLDAAKMFRRWAHQLEVTAFMMCRDADDPNPSFSQKKWRVRRALRSPGAKKN